MQISWTIKFREQFSSYTGEENLLYLILQLPEKLMQLFAFLFTWAHIFWRSQRVYGLLRFWHVLCMMRICNHVPYVRSCLHIYTEPHCYYADRMQQQHVYAMRLTDRSPFHVLLFVSYTTICHTSTDQRNSRFVTSLSMHNTPKLAVSSWWGRKNQLLD